MNNAHILRNADVRRTPTELTAYKMRDVYAAVAEKQHLHLNDVFFSQKRPFTDIRHIVRVELLRGAYIEITPMELARAESIARNSKMHQSSIYYSITAIESVELSEPELVDYVREIIRDICQPATKTGVIDRNVAEMATLEKAG